MANITNEMVLDIADAVGLTHGETARRLQESLSNIPVLFVYTLGQKFPKGFGRASIVRQTDNTSRSYTQSAEVTALTYSVPAGKKLYIGSFFSKNPAVQGTIRTGARLYAGSTLLFEKITLNQSGAASTPAPDVLDSFAIPIEVSGGQDVTIKLFNIDATATVTIFNGFVGWEE